MSGIDKTSAREKSEKSEENFITFSRFMTEKI